MKKIATRGLLFTAIIGLFFTSSCKDEYSEKDALAAQQLIDFALYVFDNSEANEPSLAGVSVTFIQGSETREMTTDENGVAVFADAKIGSGVVKVSMDGYTSQNFDVDISTNNYRQSQYTESVGLFNLSTQNIATFEGSIDIESDLTNDDTEFASGIELIAFVTVGGEEQQITFTTDSEGKYSVDVPVDDSGSGVYFKFPDFYMDQTIAYRRLNDDVETGDVPMIGTVNTFFSMDRDAGNWENWYLPTGISPFYFEIDDAGVNGYTPSVSSVNVDSETGEITSVSFSAYYTYAYVSSLGGYYYVKGYYPDNAGGTVTVKIKNALTGSGANVKYAITSEGYMIGSSSAYTTYASDDATDDNFVFSQGSNYPQWGYNLNRIGYEYTSISLGNDRKLWMGTAYPNTTTRQDFDYGTGVSRDDNPDNWN